MKDSAFLIFDKRGLRRMVKSTTGPSWKRTHVRPALKTGEYAVLVKVTVPDSAFAPAPTPEATIIVPDSAIVAPRVDVQVESPPTEDA